MHDCFMNIIYSTLLAVTSLCLVESFLGSKHFILLRDCQREQIRQEKLKIYEKTGVWPKSHHKSKRRSCRQTEPWSLSKLRRMERKSKRDRRKIKKQQQQDSGRRKCKRKRNLCQEDIDELAKDIALIKKLKRKKVRMVNYNS